MQASVAGFKVQIPGLEDHLFPSGTVILLTGRPGLGKSAFAKQFCLEGVRAGHRIVAALTDTTAENFRNQVGVESSKLDAVDFLLEKPVGVHEISTRIRQLIAKTPNRPVRLIFDSLSTLGTMFNPALLAPWLLDLRATLLKQTVNVIALVNFATGINPPSITRSLHPFADIILEMKIDESKEEVERLFRISVARGVSHSTKWIPFKVTDSGIEFGSVPSEDDLDRMLLTVNRNIPGYDRVFATVLFTYIARSTEQTTTLADRKRSDLPSKHLGLLRQEVDRFRGREVFRARDGTLAIFDRPERAVLCACSVRDKVRSLGLDIRAGLHAGEVQLIGNHIAGIAVHIGARIASRANPSEVLVSSILKDLVAGSDIEFSDRGHQALKGVSGEWHLFAVSDVTKR
jgi:class 3 adenylate cyclase/KaiC/GvpD/RAD55 family RecA-like ATPase